MSDCKSELVTRFLRFYRQNCRCLRSIEILKWRQTDFLLNLTNDLQTVNHEYDANASRFFKTFYFGSRNSENSNWFVLTAMTGA